MRVARAAHLFVLTRPVKFLISSVVIFFFFLLHHIVNTTSKKCTKVRVARAVRLFLFIQSITLLFCYAPALPKRHSK